MSIDTAKLRGLAKNATPGPWEAGFPVLNGKEMRAANCQVSVNGFLIANVTHGPIFPIEPYGSNAREANAKFIAAAGPKTILALVDELDRLRAIADTDKASEDHWRAECEKMRQGREAVLPEDVAAIVACLGDDAALMRGEATGWYSPEIADNMDAAADLIEKFYTSPPVQADGWKVPHGMKLVPVQMLQSIADSSSCEHARGFARAMLSTATTQVETQENKP